MLRVTNQEDTLDSGEPITSQPGQSVDRCSCSLAIPLEDEAVSGIGSESSGDSVDDIRRARHRVLEEIGRVDRVVSGAARDGREDSRVHCPETGGGALGFTSTAGIDESVSRAVGSTG